MYEKQYFLTNGRHRIQREEQALTVDIADWTLLVDQALDRIPVTSDKKWVGFIWGTILDPAAILSSDGSIELDPDEEIIDTFEEALYQLAGRYVGLLIKDQKRLYLDPGGFFPAVYRTDGNEREVASSQTMLDIDYKERFQDGLYDRCGRKGRIWLPGRLTYHRDVRRLLPNHYLDLETWETHRHWPCEGNLPSNHDIDTAAETILSNTSEIIDRAVDQYRQLYSSLTAGRDSRLLVTASRDHSQAGNITYFTFGPNDRLDTDLYTAEIIANDACLCWEIINRIRANETEQAHWLRATGHSVGGAIMEIHPTLAVIPGEARLVGLGGEIGRGFFWEDDDTADTTLTPAGLLDRMKRPKEPKLIDEMSIWLNEVAEFDTYTTLDLAYQEFRLGCWAGPQQLGSAPLINLFGPLCYQSSIEAMHMIPPEMRWKDSAVPYMIEREWSALAELPFNKFNDYRKYELLARKTLRDPKAAMKRALTLFA